MIRALVLFLFTSFAQASTITLGGSGPLATADEVRALFASLDPTDTWRNPPWAPTFECSSTDCISFSGYTREGSVAVYTIDCCDWEAPIPHVTVEYGVWDAKFQRIGTQQWTHAEVPIPGTFWLLSLGLIALGSFRRDH
jgi:hypothetical protein